MYRYLFIGVLSLMSMGACQPQQPLPLPRVGSSLCSQIDNHSEIRFVRETSGDCRMEQGERIANTHWLLEADRGLTLAQLLPLWRKLALKKKSGLHDDGLTDMYWVGYDTVHQRPSLWTLRDFQWNPSPAQSLKLRVTQPLRDLAKSQQAVALYVPASWTCEAWLQWWSHHATQLANRPIYLQIQP